MKPVLKINDRWTTRPNIKGETYSKKSMVIPGQDMTPLEILNQFRSGVTPKQIYLEGDAHQFTTMSNIERLEFVKNLRAQSDILKQEVNATLKQKRLKAQNDKIEADKQAAIKAALEQQQKRQNTTTTINDDDVK